MAAAAAYDDDDDDVDAVGRGAYEYELWLRTDLYTEKHTQWFYFMVSNTQPNITYRFTIVNFMKVCNANIYNFISPPNGSTKNTQINKQAVKHFSTTRRHWAYCSANDTDNCQIYHS